MEKVKFNKKLTIRLDEETYNEMKRKTEELGLTQSEYLRQVILKGKATKKCKQLPSLILHLSKIGNNINQIARNLNIAKNKDYLAGYDKREHSYYAELHFPKIKFENGKKRLPHIHIVLPLLNLISNTKLKPTFFSIKTNDLKIL